MSKNEACKQFGLDLCDLINKYIKQNIDLITVLGLIDLYRFALAKAITDQTQKTIRENLDESRSMFKDFAA